MIRRILVHYRTRPLRRALAAARGRHAAAQARRDTRAQHHAAQAVSRALHALMAEELR
jgi:hypothetical protein